MNIFSTIWTQPRQAMRTILDEKSLLLPLLILVLGSIGAMLSSLYGSSDTANVSTIFLVLFAIIGGPIFYLISNTIFAFLVMLLGKWLFKGTATFIDIFKVMAISYLPYIAAIPVFGIWLVLNPDSLVSTDNTGLLGLLVMILLTITMSIFMFIFNIVGVSEAHQFSKWKAFFTILIPGIIFIILIVIIVFIIVLLIFTAFAGLS